LVFVTLELEVAEAKASGYWTVLQSRDGLKPLPSPSDLFFPAFPVPQPTHGSPRCGESSLLPGRVQGWAGAGGGVGAPLVAAAAAGWWEWEDEEVWGGH